MLSLHREKGQGTTDYALLLALIAIIAFFGVRDLMPALYNLYSEMIRCVVLNRCRSKCEQPPQFGLIGNSGFDGKLTVESPKNCTDDLLPESPITVSGTYSGVSDDFDVWVLVYPHLNDQQRYYPQSASACAGQQVSRSNGSWQVPVYLSQPDSDPAWFGIIAVLTNPDGSQQISNYLQQSCTNNSPTSFAGITYTQLNSPNISVKDYITVRTKP